jgi:hypothetical protein
MRKIILTIFLLAALSGFTIIAHAQSIVVWSTTNFLDDPVGPYGTVQQFGCSGAPIALNIVDPGMGGAGTHAMAITFNPVTNNCLNFQTAGVSYPAAGNTRTNLEDYTIEFDMAVQGLDAGPFPQGFQISIFGPGGGVFSGPKVELDLTTTVFPAGAGYQHYSFPLSSFTPLNSFVPTAASFTVGIGVVSFAANFTASPETFDFANLQISMNTAPPPRPGTKVVWSTTNYVDDPLGPYGTTTQFGCSGVPSLNIVTPGEFPGSRAMELSFTASTNNCINFQTAGVAYPAFGNTDSMLSSYTLEFDMAVQGINVGPFPQGFQISIFGPGGGVFGTGPKLELDLTTNVFLAGQGYQHYSFTLDKFVARNFLVTSNSFTLGIGVVSFGANFDANPETFDFDNVRILVATNPPPPPQPTMNVVAAKPGLRIFAQDSTFTYNQEGFGTVDSGQTWLYGDPFPAPVSYSITFADFDTVNNYTLYAQFVPNSGNSGNPYIVFQTPHALTWSITHQNTGFTTSVDWKTNAPNAGNISNALAMTTHSTNGRGTWTLTFTSDTEGSVTAPDGTNKSFSLPPEVSALFASSGAGAMTILFGTAPNNTAGFGQYIDIKSILITNVPGINESDDFTKDSVLNTALWNPGFSYNAGSVILVSTNSAYWVNWTVPDLGFGLETKASLNGGTNVWFSPSYYGSGVGATNTAPTQMGLTSKWTLIPTACLPTVDGTTNGPVSPTAFFRLSNPPPAQ